MRQTLNPSWFYAEPFFLRIEIGPQSGPTGHGEKIYRETVLCQWLADAQNGTLVILRVYILIS